MERRRRWSRSYRETDPPTLGIINLCRFEQSFRKNEAEARTWERALPAAASVELIHNFSLVHDDIQDGSELRRGRLTAWKKWGMPQAINAGDALFILAHLALMETKDSFSLEKALLAGSIINDACLALCSGQFLDIFYEKKNDLVEEDYWPMVSGKTSALLSASIQVGASLGDVTRRPRQIILVMVIISV